MEAIQIVLESIEKTFRAFLAHLPNIIIALIILLITWIIANFAQKTLYRVLKKAKLRKSLVELFSKIFGIVVWTAGLTVCGILLFPGLTPAKMLTVLGLGSVAIGFAFKDIFENFLSGILILLREPLRIGDFIKVEGILAKVEEITIRDTYAHLVNGQRVILPNSLLYKNPVTIITDKKTCRMSATCGIGYTEDITKAKKIILETMKGLSSVSEDEEILILTNELGNNSINFELLWWTDSKPLEQKKSLDEVLTSVKKALDKANIEIPFPQRTLSFDDAALKTMEQLASSKKS